MTISPKSKVVSISSTQKRLTFQLTLAACLIFWIFVFVDSGWGPNLTPLSTQLHTSLSLVGLFYVIWSTGYLPGALVGGAMLDRYGPRRVLLVAALIVLCGMLLILLGVSVFSWKPLAPSMPVVLFVLAGVAGSGGGVIDAATNGLISSVYAQRRASALNLFNLLYPLGGVCIALIDAALLTAFHNDPRPPLIFTICFTIAALFSLSGIPRGSILEAQTSSRAEVVEEPRQARALLTTLAPVIVVMMLTSGISSSTRAWTPAYLHVVYGQTPALAAALSSISWMLAVSSRLGASILVAYIGAWRLVMLGVGVSLIGLVCMAFSPNAPLATLAIALTSIGLSPIFATCLALGNERAGRSPGTVAGILLFASGISTVFCSWFFGFLLNGVGPLWAVGFCFVCMVMGGVLALRLRG